MAGISGEAIVLNNLGAEKLATGEYAQAMDAFRRALAFIPNDPGENEVTLFPCPSNLGITFFKSVNEETAKMEEEDGAFFYHKPLVFNHPLPRTRDGASAFCGVAIFNLALTMDLVSKQQSDRASDRALHLYTCSIDMFMRASVRTDVKGAVAAASNNKARIYYRRRSFDETGRELRGLENYLRLANGSQSRAEILEDDDVQGIFLNLLLFKPPFTAMAA